MSDWDIRDLTLERRVDDLEDGRGRGRYRGSIRATGDLARRMRVPRLRGPASRARRADGVVRRLRARRSEARRRQRHPSVEAIITLADLWGSDNAAFREVFTSRFIPAGTDEQLRWFNDLCRKTTSPELAGPLLRARAETDVSALLGRIRTPTLIIHARDDAIAPLSEGRLLASEIPGAQFVELDSRNHVLLEHEPAWVRFTDAVLEFTGQTTAGHAAGGQHR